MTPTQIADPMQSAVDVLARALGRFTAAEWQWQMEFSQKHGLDVLHGNQARALLAEIAPMIAQAERKTLVIQPDLSKVRAMLDSAEDRWRHITQIGVTIRVNAMRHGATDAEIEAFLTGEADFVDWLAGKLAEAPPDVSGLVQALRAIIERWDTPAWKDAEPTGAVIERARAELAKWEGR